MTASFPTSIKSFTTKVDNVTDVLAAHINDLQDEVVAIETALGVGLTAPVVNIAKFQTGASTVATVTIPFDDTIPLYNEGSEVLTLNYTPKAAGNLLRIDVLSQGRQGTTQGMIALFKNGTGSDPAIASAYMDNTNGTSANLALTHFIVAGSTSLQTFSVRRGSASGNSYQNDAGSGRVHGGVLASSITITEYKQ